MKFKNEKQRKAVMAKLKRYAVKKGKYAKSRAERSEQIKLLKKERKELDKRVEKVKQNKLYKKLAKEYDDLMKELNETYEVNENFTTEETYPRARAQMLEDLQAKSKRRREIRNRLMDLQIEMKEVLEKA